MSAVGINDTVLGTCSLCGGPVTIPRTFHSVSAPVPTCKRCGATKRGHGPVIDMEPARATFELPADRAWGADADPELPLGPRCQHGQLLDKSRSRGHNHGTCSCCGIPTDDVNCTEEGACLPCGTRRHS